MKKKKWLVARVEIHSAYQTNIMLIDVPDLPDGDLLRRYAIGKAAERFQREFTGFARYRLLGFEKKELEVE